MSLSAEPSAAAAETVVVVGIDGSSAARRAATRAVEIFGPATRYVVVNISTPGALPIERRAEGRSLERAVQLVEEAGGIAVSVLRESDDPAAELAKVAAEFGVQAIVVGARGAGPVSETSDGLGSVPTALAKMPEHDVLIVGGTIRTNRRRTL